MAQHDYVIANGTGAAVRSDLNNALAAIVSQNSGATTPSTTYAYQWWADTTTGFLKLRNSANSAWITLFQLDGEWSTIALENGTAAAPSIYFKDSGTDTGFYSPGANQVGISTGGTARLTIDANGNVDIDSNTLYVDATNNRVGLGTSSPSVKLEVSSADTTVCRLVTSDTGQSNVLAINNNSNYNYGTIGVVDGNGTSTGDVYGLGYLASLAGAATNVLSWTSQGRVGIGTTGPLSVFDCVVGASGARRLLINYDDSVITVKGSNEFLNPEALRLVADNIRFNIGTTGSGTEKARIDSSGRLLVGTTSSPTVGDTQYGRIRTVGNTAVASGFGLMSIARGEAASLITVDEEIGYLTFTDNAGGAFAHIECRADGTAGSSDYPGRLVFSTTADGASSPTERMRITSAGNAYIGRIADGDGQGISLHADGFVRINRSSAVPLVVNRNGDDGTLVELRQADVVEGTISVSGTTVQLNGAHLSRWSQLLNGGREDILRGTVLSNLDEMCEWGDQDNEQLNRMKVSDVEGDPNVSGVFVDWDNDDDTYTDDFYCAMTGDFIIRIAEGVTVQRGDLLMSAGDGTAKPQDDDIVRSKTIAKVTSTHVTCTYEDGSYCVPCVLMAC
jgi:hypothetical protein